MTDHLIKKKFSEAKDFLEKSQKICLISHRRPDGDSIGSNLALRKALENQGKVVTSACIDTIPGDSAFLKNADKFVTDFNYEDFDLIVSVDCAARDLVKFFDKKPELASGKKPFINFDHHESNDNFGTLNIVDTQACATCFIMYKFLTFAKWDISVDMATSLLHGIYFDTGSLMHSNTSAEVYQVAGDLVAKGANLKRVVKELFYTRSVGQLKLFGRILEKAYINNDGVTVSAVNNDDYRISGGTSNETGGAIDYLNMIPDAKYCVLLSEDKNGLVKGSLRTRHDDVNLSKVASKWGGGGHPKASGFGIQGHLKPVISWKVVSEDGKSMELEF